VHSKIKKSGKKEKEIPLWDRYIWNFRDLANFNNNIISGKIFRSNLLAGNSKNVDVSKFLNEFRIDTIIDLRANHEVKRIRYDQEILKNINYINIAFNPFNNSKKLHKYFNYLSDSEIAYYYFIRESKNQIKRVFEFISNNFEQTILIHCIAGKDRTGIIVTLFHLLTGLTTTETKLDYMATNYEIEEKNINIVIDEINKCGGIELYLQSCGLQLYILENIKNKYKK